MKITVCIYSQTYLVDRDPPSDTVTEAFEADGGVTHEVGYHPLWIGKPAVPIL